MRIEIGPFFIVGTGKLANLVHRFIIDLKGDVFAFVDEEKKEYLGVPVYTAQSLMGTEVAKTATFLIAIGDPDFKRAAVARLLRVGQSPDQMFEFGQASALVYLRSLQKSGFDILTRLNRRPSSNGTLRYTSK